jgi:hypothetical protein
MPTLHAAIQVNDSARLGPHGYVTDLGERSAWVDLNAFEHSNEVDAALLGRDLGELSLYGSPHAMRQLAEAILLAVDEAEQLPIPRSCERDALAVSAD